MNKMATFGSDPAAIDMQYSLELESVDLVYETRKSRLKALEGVNFRVKPGEFVSVLGPSGCGKSTLLKLVSGLLIPTSGNIQLAGRPVVGPRKDIGVVFQQPTLLPWKSILSNVLMPIRAMGIKNREYEQKAHGLLELVGLNDFASNYPNELSGGMQQRVAVARGLVHEPTLLLMDEPFAALDAMTREHMMIELQRIWNETKKSVVFITHSLAEAAFLSDRVLIMSPRPGKIVADLGIDLPRPRTEEMLKSSEFNRVTNQLREMFPNDKH